MTTAWTKESLQATLDDSPAIKFHGIEVSELDIDQYRLVLKLPLKPELERAPDSNQFHGGPVATLIDTAGDFAVALAVGGGVPTINFRVDYLKPCTGPALIATASVRRAGRTVAVADIDITNSDGILCAVGRGTYLSMVG